MRGNNFKWRSIKTRVVAITLPIVLISLWSLSLYASRVLRDDMQLVATEQQFSAVTLIASEISGQLTERQKALEDVAAGVSGDLLANTAALQQHLGTQQWLNRLFNAGAFVTRADGVAVADLPLSTHRLGLNLRDHDALVEALDRGRASVGRPVIGKVLGTPVFSMAVPIRDAQGRVRGALVGVTNLAAPNFLDRITRNRYGKTGDYFVAALGHRLNVTSSDKNRVMQPLPPPGVNPFVDRFVDGYEGSARYVDQRGIEILVSVKGLGLARWAMVATLPTEEAFAPIQALQRRMLAATLLLTVLAGVLSGWVTWWILKRQISPMLAATRTITTLSATAQPPQLLPVTSQDEIGELVAGFNRLLSTLIQRDHDLNESRERFDLAVRGSSDGIWDWDLKTGTGYTSDRWWELLGYLPAECAIDPQSWFGLIHPDDVASVQDAIRAHLERHAPYAVELRMRHKSGRYRWFLARGQALWDDQGKPTRMAGSTTDITEQREAQDALKESEAYNKVLFASSHIPLAVLDPETWRLVDCNQAMVDIYRMHTREQVLALSPMEVAAPTQYDGRPSSDAAAEPVQQALRKGSHVFEWRHQRPDGEIWDAEVHLMAFQHRGKTLMQFSLQDITARKRIEADLSIAATAFESQEGMFITDAAQRILRTNAAGAQITGYPAGEVAGQTPRIFASGRHDAAFYRDMWTSITLTGAWKGELWNRRKNGELYPTWFTISAVTAATGVVTNYVASFTDISHRKSAEDEIRSLAFYDPLTRLPNRRLLIDRLHQALLASGRSDHTGALLFIDLDNFKTLNDTCGHDKGDLLLESVARRLTAAVRAHDTVARLGGDEFVIMMEGLHGHSGEAADAARLVAEKILESLKTPHDLAGVSHRCTASIGVTLFTRENRTVDELLRRADLAMYQAKAAGRNTLRFFDPQMQAAVMAHAALERDLREGMPGQLLLHYQAQVDAAGHVTGAEALVRWQHPLRGMVAPLEFIPIAEESGLILPLGHWVLQTACAQLAAWSKAPELAGLTIAVNVSAHQLRQRAFVDHVLQVLAETGANPLRLKLELTESLLVSNVEDVIEKMGALRSAGVCFSLDDFGTGYSSLSYLRRLPLEQLKIDRSFVRDVLDDPNDAVIARTIVALAHSLGLDVMAEGVETVAQRDFLTSTGCHAFQGYLFSRPLPATDFEAHVRGAPSDSAG